jgi:hypothetical protein
MIIPNLLFIDKVLGAHDDTKAEIRAIVKEAQGNGGYQSLSSTKQDVLLKALEDDRKEKERRSTTNSSVQLHDVRITFEKISREVSDLYLCCLASI